ncbi:hypothetical protein IFR09_23015 [Pseudomonas syringae]|nr:hypothetical protein [Pseudomonas syringae]MBD8803217.1 hypothetical protein [Pseudomonas syringae]MBD8814037.1 hypothetical protein [Pseudomonas syringae]
MSNDAEMRDLRHFLEPIVRDFGQDEIGMANNMFNASLEQLHEIVDFAERLKRAAYTEMWLRERIAKGLDSRNLELPPQGYAGWQSD